MVRFCDKISVEFASGKTLEIPFAESMEASVGEYWGRFFLTEVESDVWEIGAVLSAKGEVCDPASRITTVSMTLPWRETDRVLTQGPAFAEGIWPLEKLPDSLEFRDFFAFFHTEDPKDGLTLLPKLPARFRSGILLEREAGILKVRGYTEIPLSFRGDICCQTWRLYPDRDPVDALQNAAADFGTSEPMEPSVGWSTWDYYFTSATETDVKENTDFIAADPILREKVRYIALDDGWQQREGDWREGIRYPGGLKNLVSYIREKGFEAGIWIAPTRLHNLCGTVMRRHDFLVRDEYGDPVMDEDMFVLDPTHPDGEAFLRETFSYLGSCGFTFYKLDFISNLLPVRRFHDPNACPFDALRRLFQIARESVPAGSHLMGCSLPYGMGQGVADSRRTGWDIHNVWCHIEACLGTYLPQFAANGRIYRNDLDYLVVRGGETSEDPQTNVLNPKAGYNRANPKAFAWRSGEDFSYTEAKTWCTALLMSGSDIFLGDALAKLNDRGLALVRKTVAAADFVAAVPVLDGERIPAVWRKENWLYVFNFTKQERQFCLEAKGTWRELFDGAVYGEEAGQLRLTVPAHGAACLEAI
jgi:hypothetical protein